MLPELAENCCQATPIGRETIYRCKRANYYDRRSWRSSDLGDTIYLDDSIRALRA